MASTYTTNIRLTKQGDGDNPNSWGLILNDEVINLVDSAIAGYTTISCSAANITLTEANGAADQSRSAMLEFVGTVSADINITIPVKSKFYIVMIKLLDKMTHPLHLKQEAVQDQQSTHLLQEYIFQIQYLFTLLMLRDLSYLPLLLNCQLLILSLNLILLHLL